MTGAALTTCVLRNVERLRAERGLSIIEVAEAAGITKQYLYLLRSSSGEGRRLTLDVVARLARALDVEAGALLQEGWAMHLPDSMFTIYSHTAEFPDQFVVRDVVLDRGGRFRFGEECTAYPALEDAREHLRERGLVCMPRQAKDDLTIVESWI